ncbi:MAG: thioredoxin family protein [Candidatus Omnitrophica bacterium]|nr:thioredoxin family protein [Candidatus Omnitrophota bacterium]
MKIEVVGPGCARCITVEKNVREAVKQLGISAEVVKVTDVVEFAKKRIMFTPGVIVDGQVKFSGKIPTVDEIKGILKSSQGG